MAALPYRKAADIAGAGPYAHFVIFFTLTAILGAWEGDPRWWLYALAVPTLWYFRSLVSAYLVPFAGLVAVYLLVHAIATRPEVFVSESNGGPIAVGRMVYDYSHDKLDMLYVCARLNLGIGLLNAMPFMPFDGGRIVNAALGKKFPRLNRVVTIVGIIVAVTILGFALTNDVRSLF